MQKIDISDLSDHVYQVWFNQVALRVDDYVVRVIVQEDASAWHTHPTGDEAFLVIEGEYAIDLENDTVVLTEGQMAVVPKMKRHRTRALKRSVVVCFESGSNNIKGSVILL